MGLRHKKQSLLEIRKTREREVALESATLFLFRQMAERGEIEPSILLEHAALFEPWDGKEKLHKGCIRRCVESSSLYRYLDTGKTKSTKSPSKDAEKWEKVGASV